jgi:hypothetical protein
VVTLTLGLGAGLGAWGVARSLQSPAADPVAFSAEDGARAQQKIFELARRAPRADAVVLTEAELNAFVRRHLDPADLPLRDAVIRLRGDDVVEIAGTVPLARLLRESPLAPLADGLPAGWLARPVWLTISARGRLEAEPRRTLRLDVRRLAIGRQRVPALALRLVLEPASLTLTRIALPRDVQAVSIERGRVVIQTLSSPGRI